MRAYPDDAVRKVTQIVNVMEKKRQSID